MTQRIDIAGQKHNRLTVLSHISGTKWRCLCDCGQECIRQSYEIRNGKVKSCGCTRAESMSKAMTTHGMSKTSTYRSWLSMRRRCYEKAHPQYRYYGGKGITVCKRWLNSFDNFISDMGVRPEGTTLDRIDGKKNYTPANCRWATQTDQMRNTSRALKYQGKSLKEWSDETGIKYDTLRYRLQKHGTIYL